MIFSDFSLITPSGVKTPLTNLVGKTFDVQADFAASSVQFSMPVDTANDLSVTEGKFISVSVDEKPVKTPFMLTSSGYDYVTDDGIPMKSFQGRSIHEIGNEGVVLPSAWPNPTPSGHAFQNATPGTIIKTLVTRAQERSTMLEWGHSTFSGTTDSNGKAWPSMMDRTFNNGDTVLAACKSLVDDGLVELEFDGFNLRAYVPGTIGKTLPQDKIFFRPGYTLAEGSVDRDTADFATDIFAIGDGDATAVVTNASLYNVLGRRKMKFVQYGGITNKTLLEVLAKADLERYGTVKQEDAIRVLHHVYQPLTDFSLNDWVAVDRGDSSTIVQIKQISFQEDADGSWNVNVSLGSLFESVDQRIQRRIDAITGANAGGGAVPNDKTEIKVAPSKPINLKLDVQPYLDNSLRRKVMAMCDWSDVITFANGMPMDGVDRYEIAVKAGGATDYGASQSVADSAAVLSNYDPNTQFQYRVRAWRSDLASPWVESGTYTLVDNTPINLVQPSTPTVTVSWQTLSVTWDGKNADGSWPSRDTFGMEVHVSPNAGFTPTTATRQGFITSVPGSQVGGNAVVTSLDGLTTYFVALVPVGPKGTPGPKSDEASATTAAMVITPAKLNSIDDDLARVKNDLVNTASDALSRGADLITNGTGGLKSNRNFSAMTYLPTDAPSGSVGSFLSVRDNQAIMSDELIPVDTGKKYVASGWAKETTTATGGRFYLGFTCYDSAGVAITPYNYLYKSSLDTTLAADLKPGDTTVSLSNATGWGIGVANTLFVWDYKDAQGRVWPIGTFTRRTQTIKSVDGNILTLSAPWPANGGTVTAGTTVSNGMGGSSYQYSTASSAIATSTWTRYQSPVITGTMPTGTGTQTTTNFAPGTAYIKYLILANYIVPGARQAFSGLSFSEAAAAQASADRALTVADGKNTITWSLNDPSDKNNPGKAWGDTWYKYTVANGTAQVLGQWYWYGTWTTTQIDGVVITDNSITTPKLRANSVTTDILAANAVTANKIAANTITALQIDAASIGAAVGSFTQVKADNILAGNLTVGMQITTGLLTAGPLMGTHTVLTAGGFKAFAADLDPTNQPNLSVALGTGSADVLSIYNSSDPTSPAAQITQDGNISGNSLSSEDDITINGVNLLGTYATSASNTDYGWLDQLPRGLVAYGDARDYVMSLSGTLGRKTYMFARLGFILDPKRAYRITFPYRLNILGVNGDPAKIGARLFYTWSDMNDSPMDPSSGSIIVAEKMSAYDSDRTAVGDNLSFVWYPAEYGGQPINVKMGFALWSTYCDFQPVAGYTGDWKVAVEDIGPTVSDTIDTIDLNGLSTLAAKRTYVSTWTASDSQTFLANGNKDSYGKSNGITRSGYWNSSTGDMKTLFLFNNNATSGEVKTMASALNGATVVKAEVFVQTTHWYGTNGGSMYIRSYGGNTMPATLSDGTARSGSSLMKKYTTRNQGFWIQVPVGWFSSSFRAFLAGPAGSQTPAISYNHMAGHNHPTVSYRPKVRLTYTR